MAKRRAAMVAGASLLVGVCVGLAIAARLGATRVKA